MNLIKTCKNCSNCKMTFDMECKKCPVCDGELTEISTPYTSTFENWSISVILAIFSPFSLPVITANDPRVKKIYRYIFSCMYFLLMIIGFVFISETIKSTTIPFYIYMLTNIVLLLGVFHIFWSKYSSFKKVLSIVYSLLVFIMISVSIFDKALSSEVKTLTPDPIETSESINTRE